VVGSEPRVDLEYAEIRDAHELTPIALLDGSVLIALAARVGATRVIDNALVDIDGSRVRADLGVGGGSPCNAR
jgi:pantoate--beta-alanine ligase